MQVRYCKGLQPSGVVDKLKSEAAYYTSRRTSQLLIPTLWDPTCFRTFQFPLTVLNSTSIMPLQKQNISTFNTTHQSPWDPSSLLPSCCNGTVVCVKMPNHPVSYFSVYISNMRSVTTLKMPGWYGAGHSVTCTCTETSCAASQSLSGTHITPAKSLRAFS